VLEIESGSNDPMAVMLTLGLLLYLAAPTSFGALDAALFLVLQITVGAAVGWYGGRGLGWAIERLELGESLYPLLALFGGLGLYGLAATLHGSGFLAVYLAGISLGSRNVRQFSAIRRFHDVVAWLAQIGLFLMLGVLVTPSRLLVLALPALGVALALILLARPLAVLLAMAPFRFRRNELAFISWVGLRGSVPIVLATYPWLAGLPNADLVFNVVFFIVLVSLVLQGWTVAPAARLLGLQVPQPEALVHRVDLDLPGSRGYEIVSYRIGAGSALLGRLVRSLPMRDLSRIVCIVRGGRVLRSDEWDRLSESDYLSLLVRRDELAELDRQFRNTPRLEPSRLRTYFGDFQIDPAAHMAALAASYGAELPADSGDLPVAAFIEQHLPRPVVGDRLRLGPIELVIRDMEAGHVTALGLRFPEPDDAEVPGGRG
jgi:NhaP-type Na+/H+ and K+/H+ antiporters with a unique C-terminal domain